MVQRLVAPQLLPCGIKWVPFTNECCQARTCPWPPNLCQAQQMPSCREDRHMHAVEPQL